MGTIRKRLVPAGLCLLLTGILVWALAPDPGAAVAADGPAPEQECRYVIRSYQGEVAVFLPRQTYGPKYITGIRVDTLPQADRTALEAGIPVYTDAQLTALLEDLGS